MSNVRRRVLRSPAPEPARVPVNSARQARQRAKLAKARSAFKRWLTRLKRASNTVTALHQTICRLECAIGSD